MSEDNATNRSVILDAKEAELSATQAKLEQHTTAYKKSWEELKALFDGDEAQARQALEVVPAFAKLFNDVGQPGYDDSPAATAQKMEAAVKALDQLIRRIKSETKSNALKVGSESKASEDSKNILIAAEKVSRDVGELRREALAARKRAETYTQEAQTARERAEIYTREKQDALAQAEGTIQKQRTTAARREIENAKAYEQDADELVAQAEQLAADALVRYLDSSLSGPELVGYTIAEASEDLFASKGIDSAKVAAAALDKIKANAYLTRIAIYRGLDAEYLSQVPLNILKEALALDIKGVFPSADANIQAKWEEGRIELAKRVEEYSGGQAAEFWRNGVWEIVDADDRMTLELALENAPREAGQQPPTSQEAIAYLNKVNQPPEQAQNKIDDKQGKYYLIDAGMLGVGFSDTEIAALDETVFKNSLAVPFDEYYDLLPPPTDPNKTEHKENSRRMFNETRTKIRQMYERKLVLQVPEKARGVIEKANQAYDRVNKAFLEFAAFDMYQGTGSAFTSRVEITPPATFDLLSVMNEPAAWQSYFKAKLQPLGRSEAMIKWMYEQLPKIPDYTQDRVRPALEKKQLQTSSMGELTTSLTEVEAVGKDLGTKSSQGREAVGKIKGLVSERQAAFRKLREAVNALGGALDEVIDFAEDQSNAIAAIGRTRASEHWTQVKGAMEDTPEGRRISLLAQKRFGGSSRGSHPFASRTGVGGGDLGWPGDTATFTIFNKLNITSGFQGSSAEDQLLEVERATNQQQTRVEAQASDDLSKLRDQQERLLTQYLESNRELTPDEEKDDKLRDLRDRLKAKRAELQKAVDLRKGKKDAFVAALDKLKLYNDNISTRNMAEAAKILASLLQETFGGTGLEGSTLEPHLQRMIQSNSTEPVVLTLGNEKVTLRLNRQLKQLELVQIEPISQKEMVMVGLSIDEMKSTLGVAQFIDDRLPQSSEVSSLNQELSLARRNHLKAQPEVASHLIKEA